MSGGFGFVRLHTTRILALALGVWCVSAGAMSQQSPPVFRGNVELFTVRVHVTAGRGQPMPELDSTAFSIRIGSRTPVVLFAEHVAIPTEAERTRGPFAFFKPVPNQLSALYVVGVEASAAYCGKAPNVRVKPKAVKVKAWAWTPGRGCIPPGARVISLERGPKGRVTAFPPLPATGGAEIDQDD
jgi:hypothetical protein